MTQIMIQVMDENRVTIARSIIIQADNLQVDVIGNTGRTDTVTIKGLVTEMY